MNSFKEKDPIQYFKDRMKYNLFNYEQYVLIMDFFKQKKKEIMMCDIDDIFKDELTNSINILELIANVNVGYNENIDVEYRITRFKETIKNIDKVKEDLKEIWLKRNKYSKLDNSLCELDKLKQFAIMSIDYYQGGKE